MPDDLEEMQPAPPVVLPYPGIETPDRAPVRSSARLTRKDEHAMKDILEKLTGFLPAILDLVSPELRRILVEAVKKMEGHARETANPFDDAAVGLLKALLRIEENA